MAEAPATRRPVAEITAGEGGPEAWSAALGSLRLETGVAPSVNVLTLTASADRAPTVKTGDDLSLRLGYADGATAAAFTGRVAEMERGVHGTVRVTALDGSARLARLRLNRSYEERTAGDVVRDLAGEADVEPGEVDDGPDFPFLVVDDRTGAWRQMAELGRRSGAWLWVAPGGRLRFGEPPGATPPERFTPGEDVLAVRHTGADPTVAGVRAVGEGAAGTSGEEAWAWLVKDPAPVTAEAGEGEPGRLRRDPALRSGDAARGAAEGALAAARRADGRREMLVPGRPGLAVGDTVEIGGEDDELAGGGPVVAMTQTLTKGRGFLARVRWAPDGGAGGRP